MLQQLLTLQQQGTDHVLITVAASRGSTPAPAGQKLITTSAGLHSGTVGGGKIEARALSHAATLLSKKSTLTDLQTWNLQRDIGMTCGGEMTLLFEVYRPTPTWHIAIFGSGHIVQALAPVLSSLPCRIDIIDTRAEWLSKLPTFSNITTHLVTTHTEALHLITPETQALSITQGHSTDLPILASILEQHPQISFLGTIGSASKRATLTRELRETGTPPELIEKIHCPLGLPIGDNTPAEISISIAAQLLQQKPKPLP
ncbi:MAG: xanthine dehydrogenase accessory protein XdhC [Luteolibacter sp.]